MRAGSPREAERSAAVAAGRMSADDPVMAMIDSFDDATALATFSRLAARGTAVTPTLNGSRILAYLDQDTHAGDAYLKFIGRGLQATYEGRVPRAVRGIRAVVVNGRLLDRPALDGMLADVAARASGRSPQPATP